MTEFIDPEELPFTHAEIYAAAQTFLPGEAARQMADHLVACGPDLIAARSERRAGWLLAGVANAERRLLHGWVYPDELLPALATLSPGAAARIDQLRRALASNHSDRAV